MSLEDELREFMQETRTKREDEREFRGEVRAFMKNADSYIGAVNAKASAIREELQDHAGNQSAHVSIKSLSLIISLLGAIYGLVFWVISHGKQS